MDQILNGSAANSVSECSNCNQKKVPSLCSAETRQTSCLLEDDHASPAHVDAQARRGGVESTCARSLPGPLARMNLSKAAACIRASVRETYAPSLRLLGARSFGTVRVLPTAIVAALVALEESWVKSWVAAKATSCSLTVSDYSSKELRSVGQVTNRSMKVSRRTHSSHHAHVATAHTHHVATHAHHATAHRHVHATHGVRAHRVHAHIAATATIAHPTAHVTAHHTAAVEAAPEVVHTAHRVAKVIHRRLGTIATHVATHVSTSGRKVAVVLVGHAAPVEVATVIVISAPVVVAALIAVVAGGSAVIPTLVSRGNILGQGLEWVDVRRAKDRGRLLCMSLVSKEVLDLVFQSSSCLW